jgi:hypothetical protein
MMVSVAGTLAGYAAGGTWAEQARKVVLLAGELGIALDEQALVLCDVRDLLALRGRLEGLLHAPTRRRWRELDRSGILSLSEKDRRVVA